jgi:tRNA(Ile)-lysidine synthase
MSLTEQIRLDINEQRLFRPGQRILVAVSGGVDSMVLLHLLHQLSQGTGWRLTVAHLNHQLRGSSSNADERLVRRTAEHLRLPAIVSRADVRGAAKVGGVSLEMAARKLRHEFLARAALTKRIPTVALAHHLDDQVELFFLRLLRGSGSQALAGMKSSSPSPVKRSICLVRPLLSCTKSALLQFASEQGIKFREDCSNASLDIQRNRIRHELLPLLRRNYQPGLSKSILRLMDILGSESDFVTATAQAWLAAARNSRRARSKPRAVESSLNGLALDDLPVALQRRCVQIELLSMGLVPDYVLIEHLRQAPDIPIEISRNGMAALLDFETDNSVGKPGPRTGALRLVRRGNQIVGLKPANKTLFDLGFTELDIRKGGRREWHGVKLTWRIQHLAGPRRRTKNYQTEAFDLDRVGVRVQVRHWRQGDRFQPIGMERPVKLQDLFVNQKVPQAQRRRLLLACTNEGEVFWVEGLRISERFKLTKSTIRRLHWRWQRL